MVVSAASLVLLVLSTSSTALVLVPYFIVLFSFLVVRPLLVLVPLKVLKKRTKRARSALLYWH